VKYCPECAYNLDKGTEKLGQMVPSGVARDDKNSSNGINETKGDIIGTGFSGSGNIVGKGVVYSIQGNVLNFNISGESSISKEFIEQLQKMVDVPTQLESPTSSGQSTRQDNLIKLKETSTTKQQISNVLDEVLQSHHKYSPEISYVQTCIFRFLQSLLRHIIVRTLLCYYSN
jgi:hypothetical protein